MEEKLLTFESNGVSRVKRQGLLRSQEGGRGSRMVGRAWRQPIEVQYPRGTQEDGEQLLLTVAYDKEKNGQKGGRSRRVRVH